MVLSTPRQTDLDELMLPGNEGWISQPPATGTPPARSYKDELAERGLDPQDARSMNAD